MLTSSRPSAPSVWAAARPDALVIASRGFGRHSRLTFHTPGLWLMAEWPAGAGDAGVQGISTCIYVTSGDT